MFVYYCYVCYFSVYYCYVYYFSDTTELHTFPHFPGWGIYPTHCSAYSKIPENLVSKKKNPTRKISVNDMIHYNMNICFFFPSGVLLNSYFAEVLEIIMVQILNKLNLIPRRQIT